ncbi:hypothetical protein CH330_01465 [candidate division WOR-3 bacterium JGI_Cruoil_03_51_56]|uniref:Uncharacterized protein n=1 Tax=candidate division WOR-3 bacterium JGI_Cruoil_03_51_56 TaxID=1973747 RepID=A0A235BZJ6_UNCW3|nr:MAG: hypothetical protein CH330_01465 [candidate division WOR-3 bacterium JGI_Cruoil_03_51_56]
MELLTCLVNFVSGLLSFLLGTWIFFKYFLPRLSRDTAITTADAILKHPTIQPKIKELEAIIEKAKQLDFQELIDLAKGIKIFIELQTNNQPPPPPPKKTKTFKQ